MNIKQFDYPLVRVRHERKFTDPKGGMTLVEYYPTFGSIITGLAICSPDDMYDKRKGKSIAFGRLMRTIDFFDPRKVSKRLSVKTEIEVEIRTRIGKIDEELFEKARLGEQIR